MPSLGCELGVWRVLHQRATSTAASLPNRLLTRPEKRLEVSGCLKEQLEAFRNREEWPFASGLKAVMYFPN